MREEKTIKKCKLDKLVYEEDENKTEYTIKEIVEKILRFKAGYAHDREAHSKGTCSYNVLAVCSATEHKILTAIDELIDYLKCE